MLPTPFAPFRIRPGDPIGEAEALAARTRGGPLVVDPADPSSMRVAPTALARVAAGSVADPAGACIGADGRVSGAPGHERACPHSPDHRTRVVEACRKLLDAGFAGVLLDRPDLFLGLGLLGAGFCRPCQEAFHAILQREYGAQLEPFDFGRVVRDELAGAPGALDFRNLHFGRDFWRFRLESLSDMVAALTLPLRDSARASGRPFALTIRFDQSGPAQFQAARLLDGAVLPLSPLAHHSGVAEGRLWRSVMGRRPVAARLPDGTTDARASLLAASLATAGVSVGLEEGGRAEALLPVRALLADHAGRRRGSPFTSAVDECLLFYSPEADLWSSGLHRGEFLEVGELLSRRNVQWDVATGGSRLQTGSVLILPQVIGMSPVEAAAVTRFVEGGGKVLVLGDARAATPGGRGLPPFLPEAKVGRLRPTRAGKGALVAMSPLFASPGAGAVIPDSDPILRALSALSGRRRQSIRVSSATPLAVSAWRPPGRLDLHLAPLAEGGVRGATLAITTELAGSAKRARFRASSGVDEKFALVPEAGQVTAVLPEFSGYGVLSLVP